MRLVGVLVELFAGLAGLLDDEMGCVLFNDLLDRWVLVAGDNDEAVALAQNMFVVCGDECDGFEAGCIAPFAVVGKRARGAVSFGSFFDACVDAPEDLFVSGCPLREVHEAIIPLPSLPRRSRQYSLAGFLLGRVRGLVELVDEFADEPLDLVSDRADLLERQVLGVG